MAVRTGLEAPLLPAEEARGAHGDPEIGEAPADAATTQPTDAAPTKQPPVDRVKDKRAVMTVGEASYLMANFVLNFGIFSVPMAFARTGWAAIGVVILAGGMCLGTGMLLGRVFERLQVVAGIPNPTYSDAARMAGGPILAVLMTATCLLELATYAWGNQIVLTTSIGQLLPGVSSAYITAGSTVLSLLLSAIPDKAYAYVSLMSVLCISMACAMVIASGWVLPEWARADEILHSADRLPVSFSLVVFGAAAHPCLPLIYQNTGSRSDFNAAIRNGWALWTASAVLFGAMTYYMFGDAVQVLALQNIGRDLNMQPLPEAEYLRTLAVAWVVIKVQGAQVPISRPFMGLLARAMGVELPKGNGGLRCFLLSIPVLLFIAAGAVALQDDLGALECVTGSLLMTINAFIFPTLVYVILCKPAHLQLGVGKEVVTAAVASSD